MINSQDSWYGKMSPELSAQTKGKTSGQFLTKSLVSLKNTTPMFLSLVKDGQNQDAYTMRWEVGLLLGDFTMRNFGSPPTSQKNRTCGRF